MRRPFLLLCLLFVATVSVCAGSEPNAIPTKLAHDTTLQGFSCARGPAWFYPDGALNQCTLSKSAEIGDLRIPRGSIVELWPDGGARYVMLPHAVVLAGYRLRGGTRLALAHGATTAFYQTGALHSFYLNGNQSIQGVPCSGGAWNTFSDPTGSENRVDLYQDGKLESCRLSRGMLGFRGGQRIVMPRITVTTAAVDLGRSGAQ
jgi:hypothetical protein